MSKQRGRAHKRIKVGTVFGRLTVRKYVGVDGGGHARYLCRCECGESHTTPASCLRNGSASSCGCLRKEKAAAANSKRLRKHGLGRHPVAGIWRNMRSRCYKTQDAAFDRYGGRGIKVCDRWHDIRLFIEDMGPRPAGHTLERIDNDGHYEPGNCKWATPTEQALNRRSNVLLTHAGRTMHLSAWAREVGLSMQVVSARVISGWSHERALTTPVRKQAPRRRKRRKR